MSARYTTNYLSNFSYTTNSLYKLDEGRKCERSDLVSSSCLLFYYYGHCYQRNEIYFQKGNNHGLEIFKTEDLHEETYIIRWRKDTRRHQTLHFSNFISDSENHLSRNTRTLQHYHTARFVPQRNGTACFTYTFYLPGRKIETS